jgi:mannose/cellobiose epimerase-like protein (N-acyl-D-glucosamine 2-epimerase family)
MKRRQFLGAAVGAGSLLTALPGCSTGEKQRAAGKLKAVEDGQLAGLSLKALREQYWSDLFDDFLPFMERYVIDYEYGGFMCNADRDGTRVSTDKSIWFEGRGIWVYSFLYNNLAKEEKYLDVARKSVEFVLKIQPQGEYSLWPRQLTREGQAKSEPTDEIYGDLFVAEGLAEFSKATGESKYWDMAKEIVLKCVKIYDREDYRPVIGQTYFGPDARPFPGARILGVWMVLIRVTTQMLEMRSDPDLEALADRCVEAITKWHYNPEFRLLNELLNHDLSRPTNEYGQLVYTGHAIETLWMLLYEAVRRRDKSLFELTADWFRRHVEVAWDDVYGGVFRELKHVDDNIWILDKVLWAQEEVLIGAMYVIEHLGKEWARKMFDKTYRYVLEKYPLKQYGFPLWILYADRKVTFERRYTRIGNYHHPRHLMLNLLSIDRIIERDGNVSRVFA